MKNHAVLLAPEFRLQATLRHTPERMERPVALLEMDGTKPRVAEMTGAAQRRMVERGMTPTQALARCADLELINGNAGHERSAQEALLQAAETLSPFLESTGPGVVTVELPAQQMFSESELAERIVVPLQALGLRIQVGVAETPDLALLAARFAEPVKLVREVSDFLAPLPVTALQPGRELAAVLHSWGIHTIGQFVALPSAQVWERLGPEAIGLWERATGGRARPLRLIKPREFFAEEADLEHAIEMLEPLLFLLRRFLEQIAKRLAQAYLVAGKMRLVLRLDMGEPYRRIFAIARPTREVEVLFRIIYTHLENFTTDSPIVGLELAAQPARPQAEQFGLLERGLRDPQQFAETIGRLQALLGSERVGSAELESSHHPEAFRMKSYDTAAPAPGANEELLVGVPWLRFRPPLPAEVELEEARPVYLRSARSTGPIHDRRGPWIIEGNWWEARGWSRQEWDIATDDGMFRLVRAEAQWFLEGIYA